MEQAKYSAREARANFSELLSRACYAKEDIVITRQGKNMAVIMAYDEYERYLLLKDLQEKRSHDLK